MVRHAPSGVAIQAGGYFDPRTTRRGRSADRSIAATLSGRLIHRTGRCRLIVFGENPSSIEVGEATQARNGFDESVGSNRRTTAVENSAGSEIAGRRDRRKILVLVKGLGIGGAEQLIVTGASYRDATRFDYQVAYVLPWKDQLVGRLGAEGVPVTCIGGRDGKVDLTLIRRLRHLIRSEGIDLVHAHLPATGILARLVSPVPVVYTEHNLVDSYRLSTRVLNRLTYRRNAAVTAVSSSVANSARRYPGPHPIVVENGVDLPSPARAPSDIRDALGLASHERLVVHVGNIRPHKGHENLLNAAKSIAEIRDDVVIVSIGGEKYPGDLERLRKAASSLGIDHTIRFLGRLENAVDFVAAADVYVNPADVEGLPVSILEALALETPVVATAAGGVGEVLEHGVTGYLVPIRDPEALTEGILKLLDSPAIAGDLARRGRQLVLDRFGIERMVRKFESLYSDLGTQ